MPFWSKSSPFDEDVEKVTSEFNTKEDLALIMDIVDKVKVTTNGSSDCLKSISKRITNKNPHISLQALNLLDYCVSNCGYKFHQEVASRDFVNELKSLINGGKVHAKVIQKLKFYIKKWTENEFKNDSSLSLIISLYESLKADNHEFHDPDAMPTTSNKERSLNLEKQEMENLRKAMEESLKLEKQKKNTGTSKTTEVSNLYPNVSATGTSHSNYKPPSATAVEDDCKVRALYDFEAVEENELTFKAGELVVLIDESDAHWWKGSNHRGQGLFPANFVTKNISDSEPNSATTVKKTVSFNGEVEVKQFEESGNLIESTTVQQPTQIDESVIVKALALLHEADAGPDGVDTPELIEAEEKSKMMTPLIDSDLEAIDRRYNALCELNSTVTAAMQLYHHLMRSAPRPQGNFENIQQPSTSSISQSMPLPVSSGYYPQQPSMQYNQNMPVGVVLPPGGGQQQSINPTTSENPSFTSNQLYNSMQSLPSQQQSTNMYPPGGGFTQTSMAQQIL